MSLVLPGCEPLTLALADVRPNGAAAAPPVLGPFGADPRPIEARGRWESDRRPMLRAAFERHVFGVMPDSSSVTVRDKRLVDPHAYGGSARLEEWTLSAQAEFNGVSVETAPALDLDGFPVEVVLPADREGPFPVVIMQTFCPSWVVMQHEGVARPANATSRSGLFGAVATYLFGRYICSPPFEAIARQGFAVVVLYPSPVIPDSRETAPAALARLAAGHVDPETAWGAVGAWGWLYSRIVDALEADDRFRSDAMIVWGHSRYGKAALAAAAYDDRIDGVVAHQSGTGGASLNRDKRGETLKRMTKSYPYWFSPAYAGYAGREAEMPVDQHQLLALIAPRPLLLGNARRDVWSDPNGAFRAAMGADPAWALYDREGLAQERLDVWRPDADIAFWMRPGTHGVVEEDWPAFLQFLTAHFQNAGEESE